MRLDGRSFECDSREAAYDPRTGVFECELCVPVAAVIGRQHRATPIDSAEDDMSAENKALVRRWFEEVWNKGRVDAIPEMVAERAIVHALGEVMRGPAEFKPFHAAFRGAFPDIAIVIEDAIAEGNVVAARWSCTGTHQGDGLGFPATGRKMHVTGMVFLRVEGGQFVEGWNCFDQLGMLQQLGVVTPPPPAR
jgi:steroid delta-isomerase-like uncharacterized protein